MAGLSHPAGVPALAALRPLLDRLLVAEPQLTDEASVLGAVSLADVRRRPVRWLWPARIPLGKRTVLDGDPGLGKSAP